MNGVAKRFASRLARTTPVAKSLLRLTRPRRYLVLAYHRVNDDAHPLFPGTPTALFRRQMTMLRDRFAVLPLEELATRAEAGDVPENAVAITFDDGYRDNYTNAFPVLRDLGLPATIFLVTDALDGDRLIWHDAVFDALSRTSQARVSFDGETLDLDSPEARRRSLAAVLAKLRGADPDTRERLLGSLLRALAVEPPTSGWEKLSWDDVRNMSRDGLRFGAHTLDHPILSHVSSEEARRQIKGSRERIETELDQPVATFAYPNGRAVDYDATTKRILSEEGFRCAVTTVSGANDRASDPLELRRVGMWDDDPHVSMLRLLQSRSRA